MSVFEECETFKELGIDKGKIVREIDTVEEKGKYKKREK